MKYLKHIKYLLVIVLSTLMCVTITHAQTNNKVKDVLKDVTKFYTSTDQYQIDIVYTMYRGLTGNNITESYKGLMLKKGEVTKVEALGSKVLHFPKTRLVVDSNQKVVVFNNLSENALNNSPVDVSVFLEYYDQSQIIDKGSVLVCEMVSTRKNFQLPYGKVILHINKDDYSVIKQELYFSNLIPFINKETNSKEQDYGRLIIQLTHDFNTVPKAPELKDFIKFETNKSPVLQDAYSQYRLIDQTEHKK